MREPPGVVIGPVQTIDQDGLRRAGRPHRRDELLHACRLPGGRDRVGCAPGDVLFLHVAVEPAVPRIGVRPPVVVGLVEQIEDDARIRGKRGRERRPEGRRVVRVGLRVLGQRALRSRRGPVEVQDDEEARRVRRRHLRLDRRLVRGAADLDAADVEPAVLVEREADDVDVPRTHRRERRRRSEGGAAVRDRSCSSARRRTRCPTRPRRAGRQACSRRRPAGCRRRGSPGRTPRPRGRTRRRSRPARRPPVSSSRCLRERHSQSGGLRRSRPCRRRAGAGGTTGGRRAPAARRTPATRPGRRRRAHRRKARTRARGSKRRRTRGAVRPRGVVAGS